MGFLKEFREFALKGNVLDLAVGVIIGAAFGKIVSSMIGDIIMPVVGMAMGKVDLSKYRVVLAEGQPEVKDAAGKVIQAGVAEVAIRLGIFLNVIIDFIILALCIFVVVKIFNAARRRFEKEQPAPAPAAPPEEVMLLREIRDAIKSRG
ncbi:MAG: large conductance mechanosensitive channel protein MscL [Phycisphaerales bacterium]